MILCIKVGGGVSDIYYFSNYSNKLNDFLGTNYSNKLNDILKTRSVNVFEMLD